MHDIESVLPGLCRKAFKCDTAWFSAGVLCSCELPQSAGSYYPNAMSRVSSSQSRAAVDITRYSTALEISTHCLEASHHAVNNDHFPAADWTKPLAVTVLQGRDGTQVFHKQDKCSTSEPHGSLLCTVYFHTYTPSHAGLCILQMWKPRFRQHTLPQPRG